jgi:hypothetical protein
MEFVDAKEKAFTGSSWEFEQTSGKTPFLHRLDWNSLFRLDFFIS